jgi:hypothetical protein
MYKSITKLINIKFTSITVDTTSTMTVFIENYYIFIAHRSSTGGTLTRNFIIELEYYLY